MSDEQQIPGFGDLPPEIAEQVDEMALHVVAQGIDSGSFEVDDQTFVVLPSGKRVSMAEFVPLIGMYLPAKPHGAEAMGALASSLRAGLVEIAEAQHRLAHDYHEAVSDIGEAAREPIESSGTDGLWGVDAFCSRHLRGQGSQTWFDVALNWTARGLLAEPGWGPARVARLTDRPREATGFSRVEG